MDAPADEKPAGSGRLPRRLLAWLRNWRLRSWRTALLGLWIAWLIVGFLVIPPIVRHLLIERGIRSGGVYEWFSTSDEPLEVARLLAPRR